MIQKITPHLWFDKEARQAAKFYTSLLADSRLGAIKTLHNTPSGDAEIVNFTLAGLDFMSISAGPYFQLNPAISLFVSLTSQAEIDTLWSKLSDGAKVLMPYDKYPWAEKYGWLSDRYGLSWQLSYNADQAPTSHITPMLMFTQALAGRLKEALAFYTTIFPNSSIDLTVPYEAGEADQVGFIKHARFTLSGQNFMALESSLEHNFTFNEAFSLIVNCDNQEEIDYYWSKLSAVPEAEQCGWLKDQYGVSWQIVPKQMNEMMASGTPEQIARLTQTFLTMKKFDLATLESAYRA